MLYRRFHVSEFVFSLFGIDLLTRVLLKFVFMSGCRSCFRIIFWVERVVDVFLKYKT